jgi:hypothetical protein
LGSRKCGISYFNDLLIFCLLVLGMANCKLPVSLILAFVFSVSQQVMGQRNILSVGPTLSLGKGEPGIKDRRGLGLSMEFYHRFFSNSGLRIFTGFEEFHRPKGFNDEVQYASLRGGYQHLLAKDRLHLWGDAGIARLQPISGNSGLFTFSTGGGYQLPVSAKSFLQFQAYYVYTQNRDPFDDDDYYGWITLRIAYGFGFGRPRVPPNSSKF